jgi:hypothetical protein
LTWLARKENGGKQSLTLLRKFANMRKAAEGSPSSSVYRGTSPPIKRPWILGWITF